MASCTIGAMRCAHFASFLALAISLALASPGCKSIDDSEDSPVSDEFKVAGRKAADVPRFKGNVRVFIGDIDNGHHADLVRIYGADATVIHEATDVVAGTRLSFEWGGRTHAIVIDRYEDGLVIDYAYLTVEYTRLLDGM